MIAMDVVQVDVHQIVYVVAVRDGFVAAAGTVYMARLVPDTTVRRCT